jgi:PucR C-terminal helix-turn-helix domain
MTTFASTGLSRQMPGETALPPQLASIMRPELPSLRSEIIESIRQAIPEYARSMAGPYGQALSIAVEQALTSFADRVADPAASMQRRDTVFRRLGELEAAEGRSLDNLQAAYRIGAHVAWQRVMRVGKREGFSPWTVLVLGDVLMSYMEELADLSHQGYLEARAREGAVLDRWRQRLLRLIVERPAVPFDAIVDLAGQAGWTVPAEVTLVAAQPAAGCDKTKLDGDVLADPDRLLVPGAVTQRRRDMLAAALPAGRVAIGPTVPLADAADSLRWARRAISLAEEDIIAADRLILCDEHLCTLLLFADPQLTAQLERRRLAPLGPLSAPRRRRLTETLLLWLDAQGTATRMADRLGVHPQTIRYRMRQVEQTMGDQLADPGLRFETEVALRAAVLRERAERAVSRRRRREGRAHPGARP